MEVRWSGSAEKHGVIRPQVWFVIENPEASLEIEGKPGEVTRVFVGHPNEVDLGDADRLEVIVAMKPGLYFEIFHVNRLTDKFRYLVTEED